MAKCSGLSGTEHWGRWSEGSKIEITYAKKLPVDFDLEIKLVSVFGPNLNKKLKVKVGTQEYDLVLEPIEVRSTYQLKFRSVNSDLIEIAVPHPFRPKDMPELQNEDSRSIGIGLRSVVLRTIA